MCETKPLRQNFTYQNFSAIINKYKYQFGSKDIIAGVIFSVEKNFALVDIGANQVGFLPKEEVSSDKSDVSSADLSINQIQEFYILLYDTKSDQLILSIRRVKLITAWKRIQQYSEESVILIAQLLRMNRGGYIVQIDGIKGFIPRSHLTFVEESFKSIEKKYIAVKILEHDKNLNHLLLSARCAYLQKNRDIFKVGSIIPGKIDSIQPYGIFIRLKEVLGLLHSSEVLGDFNEIRTSNFFVGQTLDTMIIHIDNRRGRVALSQKAIIPK